MKPGQIILIINSSATVKVTAADSVSAAATVSQRQLVYNHTLLRTVSYMMSDHSLFMNHNFIVLYGTK